jgi:flavodoxin
MRDTRPISTPISRRALLTGGLLLSTTGWLASSACTALDPTETTVPDPVSPDPSAGRASSADGRSSRVLMVYFSRAGENYHYGGRRDLEVGNTAVLAGIIAELTECDVHRIEAADPYPEGYDATVRRNVAEQDGNARPGIANPLSSVAVYDTVLLGSPIWNVRAPMIMTTFTDAHDFTGKTVLPFVTYAVSGLGSVERDYAAACPGARIGDGLAVRGEEVSQRRTDVEAWLRTAELLPR